MALGDGMGLRLAMALRPRAPNCCNVRFGMFFGVGRCLGQFLRVRIPATRTRVEGELMCSVRMTGIGQKPTFGAATSPGRIGGYSSIADVGGRLCCAERGKLLWIFNL